MKISTTTKLVVVWTVALLVLFWAITVSVWYTKTPKQEMSESVEGQAAKEASPKSLGYSLPPSRQKLAVTSGQKLANSSTATGSVEVDELVDKADWEAFWEILSEELEEPAESEEDKLSIASEMEEITEGNLESFNSSIAIIPLTETQQQQFNQIIGVTPTKVILIDEQPTYTETKYFRFEQRVKTGEREDIPKVDEFITIQFSQKQINLLAETLSFFSVYRVPSYIEFHVGESQAPDSSERIFHFASSTFDATVER